ncbi:MAG TPA: hypothetical protein V6D22_11675 [Candidatus Obscuribacterales bacterium]
MLKVALILSLLGLSAAWMPSAQAQWGGGTGWGAYNGTNAVAGVGPDSFLSYTGTGLALASPLTTADMLSNEYGITQPNYVNNYMHPTTAPIASDIANGCYGSCYF